MVALDGQFHHDAEVTGYGLQGTGARRVFRSWELGVRRLWKRCAAECEMPDAGYGLQRDGESVEVFSDHGPRTTDQKFGNSDDLFIDQCSLIFERSAGANDIIFCGYRYEPETSFYYVRNRSYCPTLGRWLQRDPIGYAGGINLYEYVGGRAVVKTDPTGLEAGTGGSDTATAPPNPWSPPPGGWRWWPAPVGGQPDFPPAPADSPVCNKYPCSYTYMGANARCFCKCAGNSPWSQYVRGCLAELYSF